MHSKGYSQRDRHSRMHRKQKNGAALNAVGKSIGRKDSGVEAMARLRYLNKKPLCLQYNVPTSSYARKHSPHRGKRREQAFIVVILVGFCKFVQWAAKNIQEATVDFLVKPVEELFPSEFSNHCFEASFGKSLSRESRRRPVRQIVARKADVNRILRKFDSRII